uniref:Uncharacterized protein n=1 Tax=Meloidogyne floridensis TaxID=298350 RepID=A0A915NFT6_9BILA
MTVDAYFVDVLYQEIIGEDPMLQENIIGSQDRDITKGEGPTGGGRGKQNKRYHGSGFGDPGGDGAEKAHLNKPAEKAYAHLMTVYASFVHFLDKEIAEDPILQKNIVRG